MTISIEQAHAIYDILFPGEDRDRHMLHDICAVLSKLECRKCPKCGKRGTATSNSGGAFMHYSIFCWDAECRHQVTARGDTLQAGFDAFYAQDSPTETPPCPTSPTP